MEKLNALACAQNAEKPSHHVKPLYQAIALTFTAMDNCRKSQNEEWFGKHQETLKSFENLLPSGSGFDSGCRIDLDKSNPERIVIRADYHHMDENGGYDGWGEYTVTVTPSLCFGFSIRITGKEKAKHRIGFRDYANELFNYILDQPVDQYSGLAL